MLQGWKLTLSKFFLIPQRWITGIMGFTCFMTAYTLRVCLNIAITQMVVSRAGSGVIHDPDACPDLDPSTANTTSLHGQYNWDSYSQGIILSSFYYGYIITHIPAGLIAERYGAKHTLGIGILITALLTLATPAIVRAGGDNPGGLIAVRVIEGLAEGPASPALAVLMSRWVPKTERGRMGSLIFGGAQIGNILGTVVSGFVMSKDGNWPNVFYIFGGLGVLWFIVWSLLVYSDPRTHPFISDEERIFLEKNIEKKTEKPVPWRAMLSSFALWSIIIAAIGHDWGYFTMVTDLPKYMNDVLKFSISKTGMFSAVPYFVMWVTSFCFGSFCDLCIKNNWLSIKNARKTFTTIASMGPGIFILAASYAGCDTVAAVILFCIAMGLMGSYYCGMKVNALDITPNYAGTATALINGVGSISGIVTPYLIGYLTPDQTQVQWRMAFWIVLAVLFVTNVVYLIGAQGEEQWWNDAEKNGYPSHWKRGKRKQSENYESKKITKNSQ